MRGKRAIPILLGAFMLFGVAVSGYSDTIGSIFDYFPHNGGWTLAYDCKSQINAADGGRRIVTFRDSTTEVSFLSVAIKSGATGQCMWRLGGDVVGASYSNNNSGNDNQFVYFFYINLPTRYSNGMEYKSQNKDYVWGLKYRLSTGKSWGDYGDCIRVDFERDPTAGSALLPDGSGYFYLARGVGLVYLYFEDPSKKTNVISIAGKPWQLP